MAKKAKQAKATRKQGIPDNVKSRVNEIVEAFNKREIKVKKRQYVTRFRGSYLFLDRRERGEPSPICRLEYMGKFDDWNFAIYKYSRDAYDADDWFFPGSQHIDGTIEGAMRAGLEAYPSSAISLGMLLKGCLFTPAWIIRVLLQSVVSKLRKKPV